MQEALSRKLYTLHVSPWSERAKWVLDHHDLGYDIVEHVPFLGERRLRKVVGRHKPRATVPILVTGSEVLTESWDIALYADREGRGMKLVPRDREKDVRKWNDFADEAMAAGRALVVAAMLSTPGALDEGFPASVPSFVRALLRPVSRYGTQWFARKYELSLDAAAVHTAKMRAALETMRAAVSGSPYVLGSFSYADIALTTALQGVRPVDDRYLRIGPATRKAWTHDELASEFADLLAWRDRVYAEHRRPIAHAA